MSPREPSLETKASLLRALAQQDEIIRAIAQESVLTTTQWKTLLMECADKLAVTGESPENSECPVKESEQRIQSIPRLYVDGASRGNPGPAAAGGAVFLGDLKIEEFSRFLGHMTNNQAEYQALLIGLDLVRRLGYDRVSVRTDSELLARQVQGRYRVKNPELKALHHQVMAGLKEFREHDIVHVRRGFNAEADRLANRALDEAKKAGQSGPGGRRP